MSAQTELGAGNTVSLGCRDATPIVLAIALVSERF